MERHLVPFHRLVSVQSPEEQKYDSKKKITYADLQYSDVAGRSLILFLMSEACDSIAAAMPATRSTRLQSLIRDSMTFGLR